ncbi:MAG: flavodoxin family protein [Roseovarius sp.]
MTQPLIAIPYFTGSGHTRVLAQAIASGAPNTALIDVTAMTETDWRTLNDAQAILFGSPTYMGSTAARYDHFLEEAADLWTDLPWRDKIAGGFTVASYPSGDKLSALFRLSIYASQMGMIWIGPTDIGAPVEPDQPGINRDGSMLGLMARSDPDKSIMINAGDTETARRFGARIHSCAQRWQP